MADIVNAGIIVLVAAFGLVAVVAGADELRSMAGPASSPTDLDAASAVDAEPSEASDEGTLIPAKHALGDDRGDKRGDGDREHDRDEDRHHDEKDDKEGDEDDD